MTPPLQASSSKSCGACRLHSRWQLCCLTDVAYPLRVIRCLPGVGAIRLGMLLSSLPPCLRVATLTQFAPTSDLCKLAFACQGGIADARRHWRCYTIWCASTIRCCAAVGGSAALRMRHTPCGCRSAHLVGVRSNFRLPPVSTMRRAKQCRYFARSLPPRERHSRLTAVRRGCDW